MAQLPSVYAVRQLVDGRREVITADADRDQHRRPGVGWLWFGPGLSNQSSGGG